MQKVESTVFHFLCIIYIFSISSILKQKGLDEIGPYVFQSLVS